MQKLFRKLNIASNSEHELLETNCEGFLDDGEMRNKDVDASGNGDIHNGQTSVDGHFLDLFTESVQFALDLRLLYPELLNGTSHEAVDIGHKQR